MKRIVRNLLAGLRGRRACPAARPPARSRRRLGYESLEDRRLLSAAPYGAYPDDTGEYMLGDVLVTVVFLESNSNVSLINPNTENWTPALISAAKQKVQTGIEWWEQTLATQFPASPHELDFHFDFTYADQPVLTSYEPISQSSDYFQYWMYDFLNQLGYNQGGSFSNDIRAFNHAQRLAHGTDWAYTLFVVNDANDSDKKFAYGSFQQAFSYAGGQFIVSPASRPASTFAHETGHMFWARDEYDGGGSYSDRRGYYNTQNLNAFDNPTPGFTQVVSMMRENPLDTAYNTHTSSPSSLAMIGWQDSDRDGIFDVLDVPHTLTGSGYLDPASGQYRFVGSSSVQTAFNRNTSGLQNDITLNEISRAEYRIDGGVWQTAAVYGTSVAVLNLSFPVPASGVHSVEIRTVDAVTSIASPIFHGDTSRPASMQPAGLSGFVWNDRDGDQTLDNSEARLSGWTVRLVDASGSPLNLVQTLEPDAYSPGAVLNSVHPQARLSVVGDATGTVVAATYGTQKIFGNRSYLGTSPTWKPAGLGLRADFTTPVTTVRLDAIGTLTGDRARLDAFDRSGTLLGRYTTSPLANGQLETMQIQLPAAEIAYVIAEAHSGSAVRLDRLRWGPENAVTTNAQGAYAIPGLPAGDYFVEAVSSSGQVAADSRREVTLADGETLGSVDLIAQSGAVSWQNPIRPTDANGDGIVSALDALILINHINAHPGVTSLPAGERPPPYLDVDGNSLITAADVLVVINQLNRAAVAASAGGESSVLTGVPHETPAVPTGARSASEWEPALSPSPRVPVSDTPIKAESSGGLSPATGIAEGEEPDGLAPVRGWRSGRLSPHSPIVPDAAAVQNRTNRARGDQLVSLDEALAAILDGEDWLASD